MEHDLNIIMIFGIKEKSIQCVVGYCYKYACAAYDCFCPPWSQIHFNVNISNDLTAKKHT